MLGKSLQVPGKSLRVPETFEVLGKSLQVPEKFEAPEKFLRVTETLLSLHPPAVQREGSLLNLKQIQRPKPR